MKILKLIALFCIGISSEFELSKHKNWKLLQHDKCGQVDSSRIIGGEEAPMNGYPWIARVGYKSSDRSEISFRCGGVVATPKIIVTAAHCVANLPGQYKVEVIRLGEHDTETDPDCKDGFCADPVVDMQPLEILIPKNYNNPSYKHDIAIIRLKNELNFTSFVKPICFPNEALNKKNLTGAITEVAGWGIYDIDDPKSSTKLQVVKLPIIENEECKKYLPNYANIGPTQMCVGGMIGKDSCGGDSGGPLMKVDDANGEPRYYLLGVVSFGSKKCGKSNMPGIYTRLSSYMEWFLNNLEKKSADSMSVL